MSFKPNGLLRNLRKNQEQNGLLQNAQENAYGPEIMAGRTAATTTAIYEHPPKTLAATLNMDMDLNDEEEDVYGATSPQKFPLHHANEEDQDIESLFESPVKQTLIIDKDPEPSVRSMSISEDDSVWEIGVSRRDKCDSLFSESESESGSSRNRRSPSIELLPPPKTHRARSPSLLTISPSPLTAYSSSPASRSLPRVKPYVLVPPFPYGQKREDYAPMRVHLRRERMENGNRVQKRKRIQIEEGNDGGLRNALAAAFEGNDSHGGFPIGRVLKKRRRDDDGTSSTSLRRSSSIDSSPSVNSTHMKRKLPARSPPPSPRRKFVESRAKYDSKTERTMLCVDPPEWKARSRLSHIANGRMVVVPRNEEQRSLSPSSLFVPGMYHHFPSAPSTPGDGSEGGSKSEKYVACAGVGWDGHVEEREQPLPSSSKRNHSDSSSQKDHQPLPLPKPMKRTLDGVVVTSKLLPSGKSSPAARDNATVKSSKEVLVTSSNKVASGSSSVKWNVMDGVVSSTSSSKDKVSAVVRDPSFSSAAVSTSSSEESLSQSAVAISKPSPIPSATSKQGHPSSGYVARKIKQLVSPSTKKPFTATYQRILSKPRVSSLPSSRPLPSKTNTPPFKFDNCQSSTHTPSSSLISRNAPEPSPTTRKSGPEHKTKTSSPAAVLTKKKALPKRKENKMPSSEQTISGQVAEGGELPASGMVLVEPVVQEEIRISIRRETGRESDALSEGNAPTSPSAVKGAPTTGFASKKISDLPLTRALEAESPSQNAAPAPEPEAYHIVLELPLISNASVQAAEESQTVSTSPAGLQLEASDSLFGDIVTLTPPRVSPPAQGRSSSPQSTPTRFYKNGVAVDGPIKKKKKLSAKAKGKLPERSRSPFSPTASGAASSTLHDHNISFNGSIPPSPMIVERNGIGTVNPADIFAGVMEMRRERRPKKMDDGTFLGAEEGSGSGSSPDPELHVPLAYLPAPKPQIKDNVDRPRTKRSRLPWPEGKKETFCHQCRSKTVRLSMKCSNVNIQPACNKTYCVKCVYTWYEDEVDFVPGASFECPACTRTCMCTSCTRKRGEVYVPRVYQGEIPTLADFAPLDSSPSEFEEDEYEIPEPGHFWGTLYDLDDARKVSGLYVSRTDPTLVVKPKERWFVGRPRTSAAIPRKVRVWDYDPPPSQNGFGGRWYIGRPIEILEEDVDGEYYDDADADGDYDREEDTISEGMFEGHGQMSTRYDDEAPIAVKDDIALAGDAVSTAIVQAAPHLPDAEMTVPADGLRSSLSVVDDDLPVVVPVTSPLTPLSPVSSDAAFQDTQPLPPQSFTQPRAMDVNLTTSQPNAELPFIGVSGALTYLGSYGSDEE